MFSEWKTSKIMSFLNSHHRVTGENYKRFDSKYFEALKALKERSELLSLPYYLKH